MYSILDYIYYNVQHKLSCNIQGHQNKAQISGAYWVSFWFSHSLLWASFLSFYAGKYRFHKKLHLKYNSRKSVFVRSYFRWSKLGVYKKAIDYFNGSRNNIWWCKVHLSNFILLILIMASFSEIPNCISLILAIKNCNL